MRPFGQPPSEASPQRAPSPFWEVQRGGSEALVLDVGRHCQVEQAGRASPLFGIHARGLSTLDATLSSLREDQQRMGLASTTASSGTSCGRGTRDPGATGMQHRNVAEISSRRRDAIKSAFRRIDPASRGWVTIQDAAGGLQRFSSLSQAEQAQIMQALRGGQASPMKGGRISFSAFAGYYQHISGGVERDREFEDLLRLHWGYAEVSDILDDMKNKFAMVGLAYAFRHSLERGGSPEMAPQAFQEAISHVGMQYGIDEVQRLFDAFETPGSLEVLRFIQHLTSAPRPPTPIATPGGGPLLQASPLPLMYGQSPGGMEQYALQNAGYPAGGAATFGGSPGQQPPGGRLPDPLEAPPEGQQQQHQLAKLPQPEVAPPEMQEEHCEPPDAPPEGGAQHESEPPHAPPEVPAAAARLPEPVAAPAEPAAKREIFALPPRHEPDGADDDPPVAPPEDAGPYPAPSQSMVGPQKPAYQYQQQAAASQPLQVASQPYAGPKVTGPLKHTYLHASAAQQQLPSKLYAAPQAASPPRPSYQPMASQTAPAAADPPYPASQMTSPQKPAAQQALATQAAAPAVPTPGSGGRRRAVTVGINYIGAQCQLEGCINDSDTFISLLTDEFNYSVADIRQLRDDHPQRMPTRKNMTAAMKWLVSGAREGDHLFFHYSGHGSQQDDSQGDEMDGKDETLVPCDYQTNGMLSDDELRKILVQDLPKGVRLTCVLDCCHSGTLMDLPYKVLVQEGNLVDIKKKDAEKVKKPSEGDIVMLSGCMDEQTSADAGVGLAGNTRASGAMTTAFKLVIAARPAADYHTLLVEMRKFLKEQGFDQVPQLSSEHFMNLGECFMPEAQPPTPPIPAGIRPPLRKALTIGINYLTLRPGQGRLAGCINDSDTMVGILKDTFMFNDSEICRLRDDRANMMPTKANMLAAFRWLTTDVSPGDELFLHYSGHGGQQADNDGDEEGGKDDTLIPCDFQSAGQISDDELHSHLVAPLPKGVRMWVMLDCCHSGTALDLPYKVTMDPNGKAMKVTKGKQRDSAPASEADVIMISGCQDSQTSADVQAGSMGVAKAAGAMTTAFRHCVTPTSTCMELLISMRDFLRVNKFDQVPQMSSEQFLQLDCSFVAYAAQGKQSRDLSAKIMSMMPGSRPPSSPMITKPKVTNPVSPMQQATTPMQQAQAAAPGRPAQAGGVTSNGMEDMVLDTRIHKLEAQIAELRRTTASPLRGAQPPGFPVSPQGQALGGLPQSVAYGAPQYMYNQYA